MISMDFIEEFSGSIDQVIVKGKQTKRPRPSSSSVSSGGGRAISNNSILIASPTNFAAISTSTEEDEDLANCLILLAKSSSPSQPGAENKLSSRIFAEMPTTTNGKVGMFVYECKTCNRSFSSFQALGGHRASHKRPKPTPNKIDPKIPPPPPSPPLPRDNQEDEIRRFPTISVQLPNNKVKIHECSICGSEFDSGQALGGHMRRHRSAPSSNNFSKRSGTSTDNDRSLKAENMLALNLNLPPPPEDDHEIFSAAAPPLVDCHY